MARHEDPTDKELIGYVVVTAIIGILFIVLL
jgi:hypothetical protein